MNQFTNPYTASNTFGFTNTFGSPAAFGSCGTGSFPGMNNTFAGPFGGAPTFQNPWTPGVGQWINTGGTPSFGYANTPTGWTNSQPTRYSAPGPFGFNSPMNPMSNGSNPFGFNTTNPTFNGWGGWNNGANWNTPFAWTNTTPSFSGSNTFNTPWFANPGFFNNVNPFSGWTNGATPTFNNSFGGFPWNGSFQTPFGSTPWTNGAWANTTPWNMNAFFNASPAWNTTPSVVNPYATNPGFFWANAYASTPSLNPAFFSGVNPSAFATNTPYFATPTAQNTGGHPFQAGVTNQPNTNPGLCRDAA